MRIWNITVRCAAVAAILATVPRAWGATGAGDQAAAAEVLFEDARKLAAAGDFEHACPKFAESQRLDPTAGTALNVGNCFEKLGKLATAWGGFKQAEMIARDAGDTGRQGEGARRAAALAPRLSKLAIVVPPAARVPGFELRRDGTVVGEAQWGSWMPADTGEHTIEATAPGYKPWSTIVRVEVEGAAASIQVTPLVPLAVESAPDGPPPPAWSTQRTLGVVLGAAGVASLVVGSAFTAKMASNNRDSLSHCLPQDPKKCYAPGVDLRNQAFDAAHVATGTFVGGSVALVAGVIVFLTAPRAGVPKAPASARWVDARPVVGPGVAGLMVQGAW